MVRGSHTPPSTGADLAALLATEQRLERMLAEARVEAARALAEAKDHAAQAEAEANAALATATAAMATELEHDTAARIAALEADADRELAGWEALRGAALERAAAAVLLALRARLEEST